MTNLRKSMNYHVEWYVDHASARRDVSVNITDGRINGIESGCVADAVDLGAAALIPGLVNAHTHLEFSLLTNPIPFTGRFTDWIRAVVGYRRANPDVAPLAIRQGIAQSIQSGTVLIGDIATTGWTAADYQAGQFEGIVFQELLGLGPERVAAQIGLAQAIAASELPVLYGLSPHAPYSAHPDLIAASMRAASQFCRPVAMHLAETEAELELLRRGTGEFREMLTEFGIWQDGLFSGRQPGDFLQALATAPRSLVIHGNYLEESDLRFIAANPQMTLVYCPRTHAAFGHPPHPWRRLLELGGAVAIGTDSRASNPDLSLFAELQFLASRHPDLCHRKLLNLGSRAGRKALLGESAESNRADFSVVAWDGGLPPNPERNLFAPGNRVIGTMIGGDWRFADESLPLPDAVRAAIGTN